MLPVQQVHKSKPCHARQLTILPAPPPSLPVFAPCSVGVVSGLRQLLEFGLFHGDPHPGNIFCLRDGRIAYVDFGNVAQLSNSNKQVRQQFSDMYRGGGLLWLDGGTIGQWQRDAVRAAATSGCWRGVVAEAWGGRGVWPFEDHDI